MIYPVLLHRSQPVLALAAAIGLVLGALLVVAVDLEATAGPANSCAVTRSFDAGYGVARASGCLAD